MIFKSEIQTNGRKHNRTLFLFGHERFVNFVGFFFLNFKHELFIIFVTSV